MDDIKYGDILLPGDEETQNSRAEKVRKGFWPTMKKAARHMPFARDVVASFYCAIDPATPRYSRGILLAALAYFVLPLDVVPDFFAVVGFSDDMAVLAMAFSAIRGNIKQEHFEKADAALADDGLKTP
jgi:uncharacterized membrane protein YkvA (DUF1232 family)